MNGTKLIKNLKRSVKSQKKPIYTEGSLDFGFRMYDFGNIPTSDLKNGFYTEGSSFFVLKSCFKILLLIKNEY
jgi:hypothetical protein